ncbi:acetamidase/formamidase family protein [Synoicihabitans lomoniglobus]|uniref:Acetamidase/formamidase family protein n=1 Tax=Synoicihabitans lomoniglobus TaxID=2909285 RepID=A0AAF0I271_9BACT|nr:acetamidase/formamidase family protein [Opitutaceae bacterium LMO-M01]WED66312.1 acetamidase/formamidase family protein [Opitutaceae bacterium LMO-M01]
MTHQLDASILVHRWDNSNSPRLTIAPGDRVEISMADSSGFQVQPTWTSHDFKSSFDATKVHALTGPIAVDGAEPGDQLVIHIEAFQHQGWAWTSLIPGLGLLPDDFPDHHLFIWKLDRDQTQSFPGVTLDLHPFAGIIGVQREESGEFRTRAPGAFGGNLDVRHLGAGATLHLPVFTAGANLLAGDCHAAQGDGEVCINGMEAPMNGVLKIDLIKNAPIPGPYATTSGSLVPPRYNEKPWHMFIESDENPRVAAQRVVRRAIEFITRRTRCSAEMAYTLCSVVLDLKISQLVNVPTMTITGYLPEAIFD